MDRRRFLVASLSGVGALAVASCTSGSNSGSGQGSVRTVRLPQGALGFPSPFSALAPPGYNQMSLIYDTLVWKDSTGELLPWLAKNVQISPDHLTYTYELRDNVKWSDGRPFTSDDVVFTFEYYAQQEILPPPVIVQPPQGIADVRATGPHTVEIVLDSPQVTFPWQVAGALAIVPKHVWASVDDPAGVDDVKMLVGSGAYTLRSFNGDGGGLDYTARDDYYLGRPYVQRVQYNAIEDPFPALLSGALDYGFGEGLRADTLSQFQSDRRFGVISEQGSSANVLYFNLSREGPLADVRFRRALAIGINRKDMVDRLSAGRGLPGNPGFLSPVNPFFAPVPQYEFDVAGANALLDAAGYRRGSGDVRQAPDGTPLSFDLLYDSALPAMSEVLVAGVRRIGVELKPRPAQMGPQLFGTRFTQNYDIAILRFPGPGPGGPNADPDVLRQLFSSQVPPSLLGATAYANPTFDALADKQRVTFDEPERKAIVADMQKILADDLPVLPLFYPEMFIVFRPQVLDQWYFTPGEFPSAEGNKQLFITGQKTGTAILGETTGTTVAGQSTSTTIP